MKPRTPVSRVLRLRPKSLLVGIAFLGLLLTVIWQSVRLERAASREARLQAELLRERARAESNFQKALTAVDQLYTGFSGRSAAAGTRNEQPRRELLEPALKFYQGMESKASSPAVRTRALERVRQIRSILGDKADEGKS